MVWGIFDVRCGGRFAFACTKYCVVWRGERQPQQWVEGQQEARPKRAGVRCENATGDSGQCDESASTGEGEAEQAAVSAAAT